MDGLATAGLENFSGSELLYEFASAPGQAYSAANIATDRDLILAEYYNAGYQNAAFDWRVEPTDDAYRVTVYYEIDEGGADTPAQAHRHRRAAHAAGNRRAAHRARRGHSVVATEMFETQRNLYDLGIFSKVDVALQNPGGAEDAKNVLLQVEEARRWAVGFGGGAEFARIGRNTAELTNPVGNAVFSPRATLELTRLNMLGKAHMMSFRTRFSALQQRGLFTYQAPRWFDSDAGRSRSAACSTLPATSTPLPAGGSRGRCNSPSNSTAPRPCFTATPTGGRRSTRIRCTSSRCWCR